MSVRLALLAEVQLKDLPDQAARKVAAALRAVGTVPHSGLLLTTKRGHCWYQKLVRVRRGWPLRIFYRVDKDGIWVSLIMASWHEVPLDQLG